MTRHRKQAFSALATSKSVKNLTDSLPFRRDSGNQASLFPLAAPKSVKLPYLNQLPIAICQLTIKKVVSARDVSFSTRFIE